MILKYNLGYTPEQIIHQNFMLSIVDLLNGAFLAYLSYFVFPFKILKTKFLELSLLEEPPPVLREEDERALDFILLN